MDVGHRRNFLRRSALKFKHHLILHSFRRLARSVLNNVGGASWLDEVDVKEEGILFRHLELMKAEAVTVGGIRVAEP